MQKFTKVVSILNEKLYRLIARLETDGYTNESLDDTYLLGYAAQKQAFAEDRDQRIASKMAHEEE